MNPGLEATRVQAKAWAYQMGMLGTPCDLAVPEVWSEADFDAHDYTVLCAYTHPDTPEPELDLVADWYVWVFYFDDHFLEGVK